MFWLIWWILAWLPPLYICVPFSFGWWGGITLPPFVFLKKGLCKSETARRHEYRHIWQARVLSPPGFYVCYFVIWLVLFIKYLKTESFWDAWWKAYYENWFERDARGYAGRLRL